MALHLNLCHEIQSADLARRRDPLKLGLIGLIILALLFVGYYLMRLGAVHTVTSERDSLQNDWRTLEPKQKKAVARAEELTAQIGLSGALVDYIETRFYWAPVLAQIGGIVPKSVQLDRFAGDLRAANECQVTIEGSAAGEAPRNIAEELRTALATELGKTYEGVSASFVSLDDGPGMVEVDGKEWPTAVFTIRVTLGTTRSMPDEEAQPAPNEEAPL